jgi:hypothetical protein
MACKKRTTSHCKDAVLKIYCQPPVMHTARITVPDRENTNTTCSGYLSEVNNHLMLFYVAQYKFHCSHNSLRIY